MPLCERCHVHVPRTHCQHHGEVPVRHVCHQGHLLVSMAGFPLLALPDSNACQENSKPCGCRHSATGQASRPGAPWFRLSNRQRIRRQGLGLLDILGCYSSVSPKGLENTGTSESPWQTLLCLLWTEACLLNSESRDTSHLKEMWLSQ